jgi:hypothetical protein
MSSRSKILAWIVGLAFALFAGVMLVLPRATLAAAPTTEFQHLPPNGVGHSKQASSVSEANIGHAFDSLQIPFIKNTGPLDQRVAYYAQTFAGTLFVTHQGQLVYTLPGKVQSDPSLVARSDANLHKRYSPGWTVVETFIDAHPVVTAGVASPTIVSRFIGNHRSQWQDRLPTYQSLRLGEVWPGIEVELFAHGNTVEKIFTLAPGVTAERIRV